MHKKSSGSNQKSSFESLPSIQKIKILTSLASKELEKSAIVMQKRFRGQKARKATLALGSYPLYSTLCKKAAGEEASKMSQADSGNTPVYLPNEMPEVVLKKSGRDQAISRFHKMQEIRSILNKQKSSHLVIPRASLFQNFLVEERLPIHSSTFKNIEIYVSDVNLFTSSVRELTRLFSRVSIDDLVNKQFHYLNCIVGDMVRYDNLPLYIAEENGKKIGKIGLIDLEQTHPSTESSTNPLGVLVRIFPYHLNVIKDEAKKLKMSFDENHLNQMAEVGEKYIYHVFDGYMNWLDKTKGVRPGELPPPYKMSETLSAKLSSSIINKFKEITIKHHSRLSKKEKDVIDKWATILSTQLNGLIHRSINKNRILDTTAPETITGSTLSDHRAVGICLDSVTKKVAQFLEENITLKKEAAEEISRECPEIIADEFLKAVNSTDDFCTVNVLKNDEEHLLWIRY